ncbi:MAG: helicase SNF2 [Acidobacteria bacterium]|nr:MAG: helicase SNF2 [Acidobacteriota bacterium]
MSTSLEALKSQLSTAENWNVELKWAKESQNRGFWDGVHYAVGKRSDHHPILTTVDLEALDCGSITAHCNCETFVWQGFCPHIWWLLECLQDAGTLNLKQLIKSETQLKAWQQPLISYEMIDSLGSDPTDNINWKTLIHTITEHPSQAIRLASTGHKQNKVVWYALDLNLSQVFPALVIRVFQRTILKDGTPGQPRIINLDHMRPSLFDEDDAYILQILDPLQLQEGDNRKHVFALPDRFSRELLTKLSDSRRFSLYSHKGLGPALKYDDTSYQITLSIRELGSSLKVIANLENGHSYYAWKNIQHLHASGFAMIDHTLYTVQNIKATPWVQMFHSDTPVIIGDHEKVQFLERLSQVRHLPNLEFSPELSIDKKTINPRPALHITRKKTALSSNARICEVLFHYTDDTQLRHNDNRSSFFNFKRQSWFKRQWGQEKKMIQDAIDAGVRVKSQADFLEMAIPHKALFSCVQELMSKGWKVELEGAKVKNASIGPASIRSGINWFDLHLDVHFEGKKADFSDLLVQLKKKRDFITLADGSLGIVDEYWEEKLKKFIDLAVQDESDSFRFKPSQTLLLDSLLADLPEVNMDAKFQLALQKLQQVDRIVPRSAPHGFNGSLRTYQQEGLGWFHFLQELKINGCLADDMGLGKTVQVLALLQERNTLSKGPSLVVVPKSLVQNWIDEAAEFVPACSVLSYAGNERKNLRSVFHQYNLVITTYGILRRDILYLKEHQWDYVVLDESQTIKNIRGQASKAARLLEAEHKLVLTGTPIENHIGELWSQFEFLNPGMLGHSHFFQSLNLKQSAPSHEEKKLISRSLAPFILRRSKTQVLEELPSKTEQTIYCEMESSQREFYLNLKETLKEKLTERIEKHGLNRSQMHVLESLLRLRQAACHPGLLQRDFSESIKFQVLLQHLEETIAEGHKALVFSQFTSLLGLLKREIYERGWAFEYLDGKSRRREASIKRFQEEEQVPVFLISLKAGGLGLNLTAADYVFILDPWWNPAVENQAIDRAHRIGQTRSVMAYRLIVKNSIEEKILQLQKKKTELADAIISEDNRVLKKITPEDLELLLGP